MSRSFGNQPALRMRCMVTCSMSTPYHVRAGAYILLFIVRDMRTPFLIRRRKPIMR